MKHLTVFALVSAPVFAGTLGLVCMLPSVASAQDETLPDGLTVTNTTEGVSGDRDKKDRDPTLSVTTVVPNSSTESNERVRVLAYAEVASHEFKKYPIRYDFFINRTLFSSQMRSTELTGPVGVEIGPDVATLPFNYTVVATVLHPNRQFTTVLHGAVFATDLSETLDCTLTVASSADDEGSFYQVDATESLQQGNDTIGLDFEASSADNDQNAAVESSIKLTESPTADQSSEVAANGTLTLTVDEKESVKDLSGSVTFESGKLTQIEMTSSDDLASLSCSAASVL